MKINAEEAVEFAAEDQDAAGDHDADDRQREATGPVTELRRLVSQLSYGRECRCLGGECVLGARQEERQEGEEVHVEQGVAVEAERRRRFCIGRNQSEGFGDVLACWRTRKPPDFWMRREPSTRAI